MSKTDRPDRARAAGGRKPAGPGGRIRVRDLATEPFGVQAMARFVELAPAVAFATSWQGYDRTQVDSFRQDIESELRMSWNEAARRRRDGWSGGLPAAAGSVRRQQRA